MKSLIIMWKYLSFPSLIIVLSIIYQQYFSEPSSIIKHPRKHYDYIIVGAGTAGCVVASQLSEMPDIRVLLIEAGGYFNWLSTVPLAAPLMQGTSVDWSYKTELQYYSSRGLINNQQSWPRGKGLGGSGQLNYLVHSFGLPKDYENWPATWSYENLIPYFQRISKKMLFPGEIERGELIDAFQSLDTSTLTGNVTLERASNTIKYGSRWSSFHAHLKTSWNRENLHILTNTFVTKITTHDSIARGIEVKYEDGTFGKVEVHNEIIITAGAVNTPQLLMISGLGPVEELEKYRIPVVKTLPQVGKNLFDHLNVPIYVNLDSPISITLQKMLTITEVIKYFLFKSGILALNGIIGTGRVSRSMLVLFGVGSADEKLLKEIANFKTSTYRSIFPSYNDTTHEGFIFLASCAQPKSRGNITLPSGDIFKPPRIEPAYFEDENDVACTQEAINLALETLETTEFRKLGAHLHIPDLDDCKYFRQDYHDIKYSECVMKTAGLTGHHPGGTCKMGDNLKDSVVDDQLRVHGIANLRIIDASVLPSPISGTPNSVLIAMAEKAVDLILNKKLDTQILP